MQQRHDGELHGHVLLHRVADRVDDITDVRHNVYDDVHVHVDGDACREGCGAERAANEPNRLCACDVGAEERDGA